MGRIFFIVGMCVVVISAAVGGGWLWLTRGFDAPGPLKSDVTLIIPKGSGTGSIANNLVSAGIIGDPLIFKLGHRFLSAPGPMRAGEYRFLAGLSAAGTIKLLQSGKTVVRKLTIAEGLSNAEIATLISRAQGLTGLTGPLPAEGGLLPETYHFSFGDRRSTLVARMRGAMTKLLGELWPKRAPNLPIKTPEAAMILASIVEKETGAAEERPRVAAVFHNRLRKNMRLQSDPTVVFGLTLGRTPLGRPISKADLKSETAFNTYVIKGLPPGPIANPGRAAIESVLRPAITDELYFVADGTGGHAFAKTLKQHQRNVVKWRKIEKARRKTSQ